MKNLKGHWSYEWNEGFEIIKLLGGAYGLEMSLGVKSIDSSKYLERVGNKAFCVLTFRLDNEDGYDKEIYITFTGDKLAEDELDKEFTVELKSVEVPNSVILRIFYMLKLYTPKCTIYTSNGCTDGSRFPWIQCPIRDVDVPELERCLQEVTGKHPNPFGW